MVTIYNDKLKVEIDEIGAEVKRVTNNIVEYMHDGDSKYWGRVSPVLFPIVGKLTDDSYTFDAKTYNLTQHGFARDLKFDVLEQEDNYCSFILSSDETTLENYPFLFTLIIEYMLLDSELQVTYRVTNVDDKPMYYQIGAHPAFKINNNKTYRIDIENSDQQFEIESGLISRESKEAVDSFVYKNELFANDALIYTFNKEEKVVTIFEDNRPYIKMRFNDFNLLGIWTPPNLNAPFICLEPWNGLADFNGRSDNEFKNKDYINKLNEDESDIVSYTILFN